MATQEVTREDQQVETVRTVSSLVVVVEPVAGSSPGPLSVQPSIMAVDTAVRQTLPDFIKNTWNGHFQVITRKLHLVQSRKSFFVCFQGDCVSVGVTSLTMSAVLKDANGNQTEGLHGNTTIPFSGCWANYTDLAIFTSGRSPLLHNIFLGGLLSVVTVSIYLNFSPRFHRWKHEVGLYSEWMEGWVQNFLTQSSYNAISCGRHHGGWWQPQHLWLQSSCLVTVCVPAHAVEWSTPPAYETLNNHNTQCTLILYCLLIIYLWL